MLRGGKKQQQGQSCLSLGQVKGLLILFCTNIPRGKSWRNTFKFEVVIMVKKTTQKGYGIAGCPSSSELPENNARQKFRLGDITWVKHGSSSWWPAQVIDEASVSSKPKKKTGHDALVRLYGTCEYVYVDPWKSNMEFEMILKEENKTAREAFHEVLQKELSGFKSPSDYDEEGAANSKAKTASRKVRKQEGLKRSGHGSLKELAGSEPEQEVGSNATTRVAVRGGRKPKGGRQSSPLDKDQGIDKASSEVCAEGLRDKTQKQVSAVRDKKGRMETPGTSVVEGSRRSGRTNAKKYFDTAENSTSQLHHTSASENAAEVGDITSENQSEHNNGSMADATHREIKAMVRDILLGDIIARQHAAEMAYVDEVIYGICDATEQNVVDGTAADIEGGRGVKRTGSQLEADSSNVTQRTRKGKAKKQGNSPNSSPGCSDGRVGAT